MKVKELINYLIGFDDDDEVSVDFERMDGEWDGAPITNVSFDDSGGVVQVILECELDYDPGEELDEGEFKFADEGEDIGKQERRPTYPW